MKILFDVSVLAEGQREILRYATLLPEDGLDYGTFVTCLEKLPKKYLRRLWHKLCGKKQEKPLAKQLEELVDSGWLQCREKRLMIHPVVREVCLGELKPSDENCGEFLGRLWDLHDFNTFYDAEIFLQLAQCFSVASERLDDREGTWALRAGRYWSMVGQAQMALTYELRMLQKREQNMPDSAELATAYNNVSASYESLGQYGNALSNALIALEIQEQLGQSTKSRLANSYNNVGSICGRMGKLKLALQYLLKAETLVRKEEPVDFAMLATILGNIGYIYDVSNDNNDMCLQYALKSLEIREQYCMDNHPDLAQAYNNVGCAYMKLDDDETGLKYMLKAKSLWETMLPPNHPNMAKVYGNIGYICGRVKGDECALEYYKKALEICEKTLAADHPYAELMRMNISIVQERLSKG